MAVWQLAGTEAVAPPVGGFNPMMIIFMLGMLGLLFFMQSKGKKAAQAREAFRSQLTVGQRVMTQGGLVGTIIGINEATDTIILDSAGSRCEYMRQGIAKTLDDAPAGAVAGVGGLVPAVPATPQYGANTPAPAAGGFLANALNNLASANAGPQVSDDELAELDAISRDYHESRGSDGFEPNPIVLKEVE
jgi:preprotein translocase subunit YajC